MISCGRGAPGRRERVPHPASGIPVGRIAEHRTDRIAHLGGAQPGKVQPYPRACVGDLPGDDRLIVPDRRDHEWHPVRERLAHGVVPAVAHHGGHVREQGQLGNVLGEQDVRRCLPGRADQHGLQFPAQAGQRFDHRLEEPRPVRAMQSPQRHQQVRPRGVQPLPRERSVVGTLRQRRAGEDVLAAETAWYPR